MRGRPKNHFKVGVAFDDIAFGIENLKDEPVTPQIVLEELEQFCARLRKEIARRNYQRLTSAEPPQ